MVQRKSIIVIALMCGLWGAKFAWEYYQQARGFAPDKVQASLAPDETWSGEKLTNSIRSILAQRYTFLGEGAQAYAFESEDGKYVLKLFKMRRFASSITDYFCPLLVKRREKNRRWAFNGYKIALNHFPQETGVLFIHLNPTKELCQSVQLIDDRGREFALDLDKSFFIVQEKAELIFARLDRLRSQGDETNVKKSIEAVLQLVARRMEAGYADRDRAVSNNYGFVGERPIHLDVGRLYKGEKARQVEHVSRRIGKWRLSAQKQGGDEHRCGDLR